MKVEGVGQYTASRRARWWRAGAVVAGAGIIAGAVLGPDFDQREVPPQETGVWIMQAAGERYARLNTTLAEIDTVRRVDEPGGMEQYGADLLVYSTNLAAVTAVEPGRAADIVEGEGVATPSGTAQVTRSGDVLAYLTSGGEVLTGRISDGSAAAPVTVDPYADVQVAEGEERPRFEASAVAVSTTGEIAAYSRAGQIMAVPADGGAPQLTDAPAGLEAVAVEMAFAGDSYMVWDPAASELWVEGATSPVPVAASEGTLQESTSDPLHAYIADEAGVLEVDLGTQSAARAFGTAGSAIGIPARPVEVTGTVTGAWLPSGEGPGTLWSVAAGRAPLEYEGGTLGDSVQPVIRDNGTRAVVNEAVSGWAWTLPDGALVASSQAWDPEESTQETAEQEESTSDVTEPRPPVAEDDDLGVRAGTQTRLPVLLNDHDANEDTLTIARGTVTELDPAFGTVTVADDGQALVVDVAPDATGSATLRYAVSDGTAVGGLLSEPATVTLTVHGDDQNAAPEWRGADGTWPAPAVPAGGSTAIDVLTGWVDPDGDPIYVASASTEAPASSAVATAGGQVVFTHQDPGADPIAASVDVVVSDVHGETSTKELVVSVETAPRLTAETFTVEAAVGTRHTIDIADAVSGAAGPLVLTEVSVERADARIATDVTGFTFVADQAGARFVSYTVSDGASEATGTVRVDVVEPEDAAIATVPLTAFVRAGEDVTLDVLSAVTNPAGTVLVVQDPLVAPRSGPEGTAQLSADVVGLSSLRLSGATPTGEPGVLGTVTYTLSDGVQEPVAGQVTVVMVDSTVAPAPGVVGDAYTVRVGTRADLPVLDNDAAAPGTVVALVAGSAQAGEGEGLAFTAGRVVRYLAPDVPGIYEFTYDAYAFGYPSQSNRGTVRVTVVADGGNATPTPADVAARVNAGQSVTIPIRPTGQDPDGDRVSLTAITQAPTQGSAVISADGGGIVYTAPTGFGGQVELAFSVTDSRGAAATATARIAVASGEVAPEPVTFTDYVQVQAGDGNKVVVEPTANDVDPLGGALELVEIRPDAEEGTAQHRELAAHLEAGEDGLVTFTSTAEATTLAYTYTAQSANGSIAVGRVVVKVVREAVPDVPVVDDTVLPFAERDLFTTGVDVVTGKAEWATGDVGGLTVAPYAGQDGVTAEGRSLRGELPDETRLVVFEVRGPDFAGEEGVTYGFLTVPGVNDYVPRLDADAPAVTVKEDEQVTFDLASMITVPEGRALEVDGATVAATGAREEGRCTADAGTRLTYTAGAGAPYTDACVVRVKLDSQAEHAVLTVPVTVEPVDPQPALTSLALEVRPGDQGTLDLSKAVTWPGGREGRTVEFASISGGGRAFDVTQAGSTLTVRASSVFEEAAPGTVETLTLQVTSHEGVAPAVIRLTVGPAPSTMPKGASVAQECRQSAGSSCEITVIGASGEVNPLPDVPLTLKEQIASAGDCRGVSFARASATAIRVSWTADAPGGVCDATFQVQDAQNRVGTGALSVDFLSYPAAATAVTQTGYGDGTLTLAVNPGAAASSYPALTGFVVKDGTATVATCGVDGSCQEIAGRTNGDKRTYTVLAVNGVGESRTGVSTVAWSYRSPEAPVIESVRPAANGDTGNRVEVRVRVPDASTGSLALQTQHGVVETVTNPGSTVTRTVDVGTNQLGTYLEAVATTKHDVPPGGTSATTAASARWNDAHGIGGATITGFSAKVGGQRATVTLSFNGGGAGSNVRYGVVEGPVASCVPTIDGGESATITVPFDNLAWWSNHDFSVCVQNTYGGSAFGSLSTDSTNESVVGTIGQPVVTPYTLTVTGCGAGDVTCAAEVTGQPSATTSPIDGEGVASLQWQRNGERVTTTMPSVPATGGFTLKVQQCVTYTERGKRDRTDCGSWVTVTDQNGRTSYGFGSPAAFFCTAGVPGTAGTEDTIDPETGETIPGVPGSPGVAGTAPTAPSGWLREGGDFTFARTMRDAAGDVTSDPTLYASADVTIAFISSFQGIGPWTQTITCTTP